jgi:HSP20 family protein
MSESRRTPIYLIVILLLLLIVILAIQGITVAKLYADHHPESSLVKITERVDELEDAAEDKAKELKHRIGARLVSDSESPDADNPAQDLVPLADWSPLQEMRSMRDQVDRMFSHSLERFQEEPGSDDSWLEKPYMPAADFESKEDRYIVRMDIPGVEKSDLEVSLNGLVLQIKGQRDKVIEKKEDGEVLRTERLHGQFLRAFTMPGGIAPDKSTAEYKDGVLTVTIPRGDETSGVTKKIEVK